MTTTTELIYFIGYAIVALIFIGMHMPYYIDRDSKPIFNRDRFHWIVIVFINTDTAIRLAPAPVEIEVPVDIVKLRGILQPILDKHSAGIYFDPGATEYPEECYAELALYNVVEADGKEQVLWFENYTFFFPEYR